MSAPLGYYPGCSQSGTAAEYDRSTRACFKALGIELADVPDWTCCGSTPAHTVDHALAGALAARNLVQAEAAGFDRVTTPCPSCLAALKTANAHLAHADFRTQVETLLGRPAPGPLESVSTLQALMEAGGPQAVRERVKAPLTGLRVVPYYGCLLSRPPGLMAFDDPENPVSMDELLAACGAEVLAFPFKTECCGAAFGMPRLDVMTRLAARILDMAAACGADVIAVACPLCQMNLDLRQGQVNAASGAAHALPVPYFTQLMGLALGLSEADIALDKLVRPLAPALETARKRRAEAESAGKADGKGDGKATGKPEDKEDASCA